MAGHVLVVTGATCMILVGVKRERNKLMGPMGLLPSSCGW